MTRNLKIALALCLLALILCAASAQAVILEPRHVYLPVVINPCDVGIEPICWINRMAYP